MVSELEFWCGMAQLGAGDATSRAFQTRKKEMRATLILLQGQQME
jgi:hypothetical protein